MTMSGVDRWISAIGCVCLALAWACDDGGSSDQTPTDEPTPDAQMMGEIPEPDASTPEPMVPDAELPMEPPPPEVLGVDRVEDQNPDAQVVEVNLTAGYQELDIGLGQPLRMMTYNGQYPGPLIEAKVGDTLVVHFKNELDEPTTVHWHGLRIPDEMDGNPRIQDPVQPGETFTYEFVVPDAGTYWYHPHVRAHEQVERGLYGPLIVRDPEAPLADRERLIVIDDMLIVNGGFPVWFRTHMESMHGRLGNVLVTNGSADLGLQKGALGGQQGTVERWRIVNTANARTFSLSVEGASSWRVIGADGGPVTPYTTDRLQVAVGQRYDLEVVYEEAGQAQLVAHVLTRNEANQVVEAPIPALEINVAAGEGTPAALSWPAPEAFDREADREVTMEFNAVNVDGEVQWMVNGQAHRHAPLFIFDEGQTVHMTLTNRAGPEHPFHLHGQFFEILATGQPGAVPPGLKDTVLVPGLSTVEILAYMDNPGQWMAHCHILEHAELGMMTEIEVRPAD